MGQIVVTGVGNSVGVMKLDDTTGARPRLGLVCITVSDAVRYRALMRKRLLQFDEMEQRRVLRELYADNLSRLNGALDFCSGRGIRLYRMTSALFPYLVHEKLNSYDHESVGRMLAAARETWPVPEWQLVHISNGRDSFGDRNHSDFVETMPAAFRDAPWIEVEAKQKELAIEKLQREWLGAAAAA